VTSRGEPHPLTVRVASALWIKMGWAERIVSRLLTVNPISGPLGDPPGQRLPCLLFACACRGSLALSPVMDNRAPRQGFWLTLPREPSGQTRSTHFSSLGPIQAPLSSTG